ncbi:MAG: glycosyltransferase family 2 protein [Leptospirales bacterium]
MPTSLPIVSIIIPAHNEEKVIAAKIQNTLALDYPRDCLEVLLVSDGSTDQTVELARVFAHPSLSILDFPVRRGKLPVLIDAVDRSQGEIVVFSDASAILKKDALLKVVENFSDPTVGSVSGRYLITEEVTPQLDARGQSERGYFEFEIFQRRQESLFHSTLGAHGAFYAIRRVLFPSVPEGTINDDFVIPMLILARGFRTVYEDQAVVVEAHLSTVQGEFRRRIRISHGNFQQIMLLLAVFGFRDPKALFVFISHKVIRAFQPFYLLCILIIPLIQGGKVFQGFFVFQAFFYLLGIIGMFVSRPGRFLAIPLYFLVGNIAIIAGGFRQIRQRRDKIRLQWEKS